MKIVLCILILSVFCLPKANAQATMESVYEIRHAYDFYRHNSSQTEMMNPFHAVSEIQGTPYLNKEFIDGKVYTTSKTQFVDIPLRLNIYNDQVEFRNDEGEVYAIATPEIIELVEFGDYKVEYLPYQQGKKIMKGYFMVVEKGEASLYIKHKITLEQSKKAGGYQESQPARFIQRPDVYYIRIGDNLAVEIDKKKDLENVFTSQKDKMLDFIDSRKIKTNDREMMIELVQYYNSL